ncbi:MAG: LD-carboxypeptidase [Flavobacteriia bacterium]|nr:LD-carboxypeptidase [Flavobacteriia bacterium]PIV97202.1 MAG: LD-carboxypeptidase [Flavobacteriaceae bacterium CG17_big_fil_post_rev_8_21_14_2_50_31_13]PIX15218.1 MAG: LD-carboxypeptidase [Flavobacteriaceae bacterium CG_4_8_14_3_um_filter_31_8]PIY15876.1 MAG: LD-carboxypeptidase [Flavobacteriaceae bacterium CG_4_10_14_3_um_filter_31_253]PIZ12271.1 MAG: LD-carboxypeptidase [Flavobacteriaceae bacterium CG_4_10_14_0_8_um_filter_31_99]PJC09820.1 MAG: LD-carboxypeptidase [Flavobacteriaceae bacte
MKFILRKTSVFFILFSLIFSSIFSQKKFVKPSYLKVGDTIAIVAPAGILKDRAETIEKAKTLLISWGLNVVLGKNVFNQNNHFAGTDEERLQDFQEALDNPSIKAIWAARGGYGSVRILDKINLSKFKKKPKWIVGYSDITAFHNHLNALGFETLHAMMPTSLEEKPEETIETTASFKKALFGEELHYEILSSTYNIIGKVSGQIVGGNLSILMSMLGSKSQLNTDEKILFIEEIGEYEYAIDRMFQSLKRAGYFKNVKAVIIGNFSKIRKNTTSWGSSIEELILQVLPKEIPVLFDFPAGHEADNRALIFGREAVLNIQKNTATLNFNQK